MGSHGGSRRLTGDLNTKQAHLRHFSGGIEQPKTLRLQQPVRLELPQEATCQSGAGDVQAALPAVTHGLKALIEQVHLATRQGMAIRQCLGGVQMLPTFDHHCTSPQELRLQVTVDEATARSRSPLHGHGSIAPGPQHPHEPEGLHRGCGIRPQRPQLFRRRPQRCGAVVGKPRPEAGARSLVQGRKQQGTSGIDGSPCAHDPLDLAWGLQLHHPLLWSEVQDLVPCPGSPAQSRVLENGGLHFSCRSTCEGNTTKGAAADTGPLRLERLAQSLSDHSNVNECAIVGEMSE
mmetsp:Transcript_109761/g.275009  ORF Transcript_109761/g.275009 Transcript_109761/m.275009 type:complete len:291 (+) Transcript_109761:904-1776(+)